MTATARSALYLTMADWAKRTTPTGGIDDVIDTISGSNTIIQDLNSMEGNLATGHQFTHRSSDPAGSWRLLNYGVAPEKSTTEQFTDFCAILETYSEVDVRVAKLNGNEADFRRSEDDAFISGLPDTVATALFYANHQTDPEQPHGLSPRYSDLTGDRANQIVDGGGSSSTNTSIWLITTGPKTCSLMFPKGSQAGLQLDDLGEDTITDSSGLKHQAYVTHFSWDVGLSLIDPRYVIRLCNIDVNTLTPDASSGTDLYEKMISAWVKRPTKAISMGKAGMSKTFWYCNPTIYEYLWQQSRTPANVMLRQDMAEGEPVMYFGGAPIHICDALVSTEDAIT